MAKLSKEEKIDKLTSLGVELTGEEKVSDLDALLKDHAPAVESVVVSYQDPTKGQSERVFSLADHGEDFEEVAEQFAEKFHGEFK